MLFSVTGTFASIFFFLHNTFTNKIFWSKKKDRRGETFQAKK